MKGLGQVFTNVLVAGLVVQLVLGGAINLSRTIDITVRVVSRVIIAALVPSPDEVQAPEESRR
ncbi:MAG TPA: hypothetical protein V6D29_13325 [Leptolyngbyaceae cyanobacterium]